MINRNRNLITSKALLKGKAHQGTSLFTSAATNQKVFAQGWSKGSSGPISRVPDEERVHAGLPDKVGVVQLG